MVDFSEFPGFGKDVDEAPVYGKKIKITGNWMVLILHSAIGSPTSKLSYLMNKQVIISLGKT